VTVLRVNDIDNNIDHRVPEHNAFPHCSFPSDNNDKGQTHSLSLVFGNKEWPVPI